MWKWGLRLVPKGRALFRIFAFWYIEGYWSGFISLKEVIKQRTRLAEEPTDRRTSDQRVYWQRDRWQRDRTRNKKSLELLDKTDACVLLRCHQLQEWDVHILITRPTPISRVRDLYNYLHSPNYKSTLFPVITIMTIITYNDYKYNCL